MNATAGEQDVLEQRFVLPPDAMLSPVADLSPRARAMLGRVEGGDAQVAVGRPGFRVPTRLVTPELGELLREFRQPSRVVDAVLRFSVARSRDPFATLDDAFDALAAFINGRLLVPADSASAEALAPTLSPGQAVASYEVVRLVSGLEDTEVYLARDAAGEAVALKIARAGGSVDDALAREAEVLRHVRGRWAPALVEHGAHRGRPFLALEWRSGAPASVAAQQARAAGDRGRLHALCSELLAAYAWLHERGVVHGDVHPGNVLVAEDGRVSVLDFGRARLDAGGAQVAPVDPARAGVAYFYEPEMAKALRAGTLPPPATFAGEQYSLAALVYYLLAGVQYAELSSEHDVLLAQVAEREPLPFVARGIEPWPEAEAVLARALAKDPAARFADVAAFRDAFAAARVPARVRVTAAPALVGDALARLDREHDEAPLDLARFALRAALARDDPELLARADVWTCRAAPGWEVHAAAAGVHRARGDRTAQARAVGGFVAACGGGFEGVAAAARLLDGAEDEVARALLTGWLREALDDLWRSDPGELPHLGMAHGRAGVLYATLHACRSAGFPHPPGLEACLDDLAALAEPSGRGVRWPGTLALPGVTARTPSLAPGWCAGSAGHAILFALAYEELGDDRFLTLAERAGDYALDHPATDPDLCCGLTGRAFALLRLHQVTGDESRLTAAQRLAGAAAAGWAGREAAPTLRRGPLGTALLLVELEAPEHAQVPIPAG